MRTRRTRLAAAGLLSLLTAATGAVAIPGTVAAGASVAGASAAGMATRMRGSSNARAKAELGWRPRYASWRQGFTEALG
mgnify:CR=1 FL=1